MVVLIINKLDLETISYLHVCLGLFRYVMALYQLPILWRFEWRVANLNGPADI